MPIRLDGSCRCGAIRFSHTPHPYQLCYCTICRKTAGGGGYAINIMGAAATLKVTDAFTSGDQFEILNFGVPFAMTSLPVAGADCGDDPVPCFADASMSTLGVALAAGNYSLTFAPLAAPTGGGSAYFIVETAVTLPPRRRAERRVCRTTEEEASTCPT